jgi:hypothetical protein
VLDRLTRFKRATFGKKRFCGFICQILIKKAKNRKKILRFGRFARVGWCDRGIPVKTLTDLPPSDDPFLSFIILCSRSVFRGQKRAVRLRRRSGSRSPTDRLLPPVAPTTRWLAPARDRAGYTQCLKIRREQKIRRQANPSHFTKFEKIRWNSGKFDRNAFDGRKE